MEIKEHNLEWLIKNIYLYYSNNIDEKFEWSFTYNRLTDVEKDIVCNYLKQGVNN